jgi:hypothetical protein
MISLAQHIELLLLDNDCVIVPHLGGFVAHYTTARFSDDGSMLVPPYRTIGFNPQLKMNDGILAESYMNSYGLSFAEATRRIDKEVDRLLFTLHDEGKMDLTNIGELRYNIHGIYEFTPYDNKIVSPELYGFDAIDVHRLPAVVPQTQPVEQETPVAEEEETDEEEETNRRAYIIRINRTFVRTVVAAAAVLLLFFVFSSPIKNTPSLSNSEAKIVPDELVNKMKSQSLLAKLIDESATPTSSVSKAVAKRPSPIASAAPKSSSATPASSAKQAEPKRYQLIVACSIGKKRAADLVKKLQKGGYDEAQILTNSRILRVSIAQYDTEEEASSSKRHIAKNTEYNNIWIMKMKSSSSTE